MESYASVHFSPFHFFLQHLIIVSRTTVSVWFLVSHSVFTRTTSGFKKIYSLFSVLTDHTSTQYMSLCVHSFSHILPMLDRNLVSQYLILAKVVKQPIYYLKCSELFCKKLKDNHLVLKIGSPGSQWLILRLILKLPSKSWPRFLEKLQIFIQKEGKKMWGVPVLNG